MIGELVERKIFVERSPEVIKHIRIVPYEERAGLVADVYDQMTTDFQLVPPVTLHSPVPRVLAGVWMAVRESVVAGPASRTEREAVVQTVSRINTCPFCVDVHGMALHGAGEHALAGQVARGENEHIRNPRTRSLVQWAASTRRPDSPLLKDPPFSADEGPQIIGSALIFHYINRPVNAFLEDSPLSILPSALRHFDGLSKRIAGAVIGKRTLDRRPKPGTSPGLLPAQPLPVEFGWSRSNPWVAGAWARLAFVMEEAGRAALPDEVRQLVLEYTNAWRGEEMSVSRSWVDDAVVAISEELRPAARLSLLAALASHQIDEGIIRSFRQYDPDEGNLVRAVSWASFAATRRISGWLDA